MTSYEIQIYLANLLFQVCIYNKVNTSVLNFSRNVLAQRGIKNKSCPS